MKTNIRAFKALALRYESITQAEIDDTVKNMDACDHVATVLTGFDEQGCSLCKAVMSESKHFNTYDCVKCIWNVYAKTITRRHPSPMYCINGLAQQTWSNIDRNPTVLENYKARAKLMREVINCLGYKQPKQ